MDVREPCPICGRAQKLIYMPYRGFFQECSVPHPMTVYVPRVRYPKWMFWKMYAREEIMAIDLPMALPGATNEQVHTILSLVSIAENGTTQWWTKFNYCENIHDGRGFTVGLFGSCSGTGDLLIQIQELQNISPGHALTQFIPALKKTKGSSTRGLELLPVVLKELGDDKAWQLATFRTLFKLYWKPAYDEAVKQQMPSAASLGFMYDIALNHGTDVLPKLCHGLSGGEKSRYAMLIQHRILEIRNDPSTNPGKNGEPQYDRCTMWHGFLNNMELTLPIHCTCYGDKFTI